MPWNVQVTNVRSEPPWPIEHSKWPVFMKDQAEISFCLERFSECHEPIKITCNIKQDWTVKQKLTLFIKPFPSPAMRRDGDPFEYQGQPTGEEWQFKPTKLLTPRE